MYRFISKKFHFLFCLTVAALLFCQTIIAQTSAVQTTTAAQAQKGKPPIIVIPGLIGSELINKQTGEEVWFDLQRSKTDDLRLPISANLAQNRDNLVPRDILRNIKYLKFLPETEIYQKLAGSLEAPAGYVEGNWDTPKEGGYEDTYYLFPYDWRHDNVENSRLLIRRIQELKRKLKRPNLKFNIIGHSMGGLIARYAAMYGDADLPSGLRKARPTWAGAAHIGKIFLVGTPNEGSISALDSLVNGLDFLTKGINIPFVQNLTKFDVFTTPSVFQLLPHVGTMRVFDENLKPLEIDIYNPLTWEKYGWAAYNDPGFAKQFSAQEQRSAKAYFRVVLSRAKRFQDALDANIAAKSPVSIYLIGANCKPTFDAMVLYQDKKKNRWKMLFRADSFERSNGTKVMGKELESLLYAQGDGVVTTRSFLASTLPGAKTKINGFQTALPVTNIAFVCDVHNKLTGNPEVQNDLFKALLSK